MVGTDRYWCAGCKSHVAREQFAKNKNRPNGLHAYCLACNRRKQAAERARRGEEYREMRRRYRKTESGRRAYNRYRQVYPGKVAAQSMAQDAVRDGRLIRPTKCTECHRIAVEAHHDDYAKPLEVRWLCRWCHQAWHRQHGEAANADIAPPPVNGILTQRIAAKRQRLPLVLEMRAAGKSQKEIAAQFGVTPATICNDLRTARV